MSISKTITTINFDTKKELLKEAFGITVEHESDLLNLKEKLYNNKFRYIYSTDENYTSCRSYFNLRSIDVHNLLNKTYGKVKVPTIYIQNDWRKILEDVIYCPHCKKIHKNIEYSGKAEINEKIYHFKVDLKTITCLECGTVYKMEDMKIIDNGIERMCGNIYIDNDKITLSHKYLCNEIKKDGLFYYQTGYVRLTFNTKTGYSYTTNKGHAYKMTKALWALYENHKTPPYTFNSTYTFEDNTSNLLTCIADTKYIEALKNMDKECMLKKIELYDKKEKDKIYNQLLDNLLKNLNEKIQSNFDYKIQELSRNKLKVTNVNLIRTLKNFNRYVNLDPSKSIMNILIGKDMNLKKNKLDREETNILNGLFKIEKVKLGKKTKAFTQQEVYNTSLLSASPLILCFKNPDNINRLIKLFLKPNDISELLRYSYNGIDIHTATIKEWIKHRGENYVIKALINEANKEEETKISKYHLMIDSIRMIKTIKESITDFDVNELTIFRNEKQFHDDITRFYNSDEYIKLSNKANFEKIFELEKEVLKLEDINNDIYIGKNRGELMQIGRKMSICVGGYYSLVEKGSCRIAYIQDKQGEYKACLELRPIKKGKETTYKLVQAKLKYNRIPHNDMEIYNKILEWTNKNNVVIETSDMIMPSYKQQDNTKMQIEPEIQLIANAI